MKFTELRNNIKTILQAINPEIGKIINAWPTTENLNYLLNKYTTTCQVASGTAIEPIGETNIAVVDSQYVYPGEEIVINGMGYIVDSIPDSTTVKLASPLLGATIINQIIYNDTNFRSVFIDRKQKVDQWLTCRQSLTRDTMLISIFWGVKYSTNTGEGNYDELQDVVDRTLAKIRSSFNVGNSVDLTLAPTARIGITLIGNLECYMVEIEWTAESEEAI